MDQHPNSWWRSPTGFVLVGFIGIAAFFLVTEHRAHVLGALPYLLLLACALGFVWLIIQARLEEIDLVQRLPAYKEYMKEVPRFFPRLCPGKASFTSEPKKTRI